MRVLLDESLPRRLGRLLIGHEWRTAPEMGWASVRNGELLKRGAEAGFDVLLTPDRSMEFQQNIATAGMGVVVLRAPSNRIEDLAPLVPEILSTLPTVQPGQLVRIRR